LLVAHFAAGNQLLRLDGQQKTLLRSVDANGDVDTSTGDTLHVFFHPAPPTAKGARQGALAAGAIAPNNVQSAVQTGHVVLQQVAANGGTERTAPQGKTQPQISTATAEKAEYLADTERLTLTGAPYFKDQQMEMSAQQIWVNRVTGEVMATRNVQATVREGSGASGGLNFGNAPDDGPAHVIADRARLDRTAQQATFTGQARLWQGQNTVEAPVLEMDEAQQSLLAHGARNGDLVHCTFASQQAPDSKKGPGNTAVSVVSEHLLYSDAERKAHFTGHVVATLQGGQLISNVADVYLQPVVQGGRPEANQQSAPGVPAQSSVERIEASVDVQMVQPGRHGTGAEIVYTASDGHFVLTGSGHSPPRIVDAEHGSLTGERLIYESEQDTVLVEGGNSLTTTKTWVKK
jgi:lipopolysaccharide export system protein LptA